MARAKHSKLLKFVVSMVEHDLVSQVFLELSEEASCKAWMLFEVCGVESPLVLKKGFKVLAERCGETL